ncbi:MAG: DUF3160 domain-containing protein [Anaerolineaceae bacterium]|nr:DUF3160 domain-containing protein [Anaerolineaceae bacterium]
MKKAIINGLLVILILSCQLFSLGKEPAAEAIPENNEGDATQTASVEKDSEEIEPTSAQFSSLGGILHPFSIQPDAPFAQGVKLQKPLGAAETALGPDLPVSMDEISNIQVLNEITPQQMVFIQDNGFMVLETGEEQFSDIRDLVAKQFGQPYYLTTDAAYHAMHLTFDELLKSLEKERFRPQVLIMLQATENVLETYMENSRGTSLEDDTILAAAYLAVAIKLFDPQAGLTPEIETLIDLQLQQIKEGSGFEESKLIPGFKDDYSAYKPVGHYAGDPELEAYFQGMTWLGRVEFNFHDPANPGLIPSKAPLLITLALQQAELTLPVTDVPGNDRLLNATPVPVEEINAASKVWSTIHEILTFVIGPSDDPGPPELAFLMDEVYAANLNLESLADDTLWQEFLTEAEKLPSPQINSTLISSLSEVEEKRTWRFLGQRFTLDSFVLQNLVFDKVGSTQERRMIPSGLDIMASLGSDSAWEALEKKGETAFYNYPEQMSMLQNMVRTQPEAEWRSSFYSSWLYAFFPQTREKDVLFPAYMQTKAWGYKDLNSVLGSWAELKHDTVLYTKMPEPAGGGGPLTSGPPPAFVEPNPEVFYRLSYIAQMLVEGLAQRGIWASEGYSFSPGTLNSHQLLNGMQQLGSQFENFAEIAERELQGQSPTVDEWDLILDCLGPIECNVQRMRRYGNPQAEMPPLPVIAAVSGAGADQILEAAVGNVDRIMVIIPYKNQLLVSQGGIFSYYEFPQPRNQRLSDEEWRDLLISKPPQRPEWHQEFILSDGLTTDWLAFRIGDVYIVTEAGGTPPINLRKEPTTSSDVLDHIETGKYLTIIDGPIQADGFTWWKVNGDVTKEGWVVENQDWYMRSY